MILLSIVASLLFLISTLFFSILSVIAAVIDRSGTVYLRVGRIWSKSGLLLLGIRVRRVGTAYIEPATHYVYAANHSSYMDIPILLGMIPDNLRLTLRSSLTRIPIWGWALLTGPFLILDRSNAKNASKTIAKAIERIRGGASVLFFPEGTRTPTGTMQAFKRGAFHLAREANVPILPVAVLGSYEILPRDKWLPKWGCRAEIRIGRPIYPNPQEPERKDELRLMEETERSVRTLLEGT